MPAATTCSRSERHWYLGSSATSFYGSVLDRRDQDHPLSHRYAGHGRSDGDHESVLRIMDTMTVAVPGAPRPDEIVIIVVLADRGRPRPRISKAGAVPPKT